MSFLLEIGKFLIGHFVIPILKNIADYFANKVVKNFDKKENIEIAKKIREKNEEIKELNEKKLKDKKLKEADEERLRELAEERDNVLYTAFEENKKAENENKIIEKPSDFKEFKIDTTNIHILQYHIGQIILEKKCAKCHSPMILRYIDNFFWACSGVFNKTCEGSTRNFEITDMKIVARTDITEFEYSSEDLNLIYTDNQKSLKKIMGDYIGDESQSRICPKHKVSLVLRKNSQKEFEGAIRQYFWACPCWYGRDRDSLINCDYKITIYSPAEIASALREFRGRGIY